MAMQNGQRLGSAPTQDSEFYPDTDGKPMAVSDDHRRVLTHPSKVTKLHESDKKRILSS